MNYKVIGAILVIVGCGGFGFLIANGCKREERYLRELYGALEFMAAELKYRLSPLSELINRAAEHTSGTLWQLFSVLDEELAGQIAPNAEACMREALAKTPSIPPLTGKMLRLLGKSLGKFDLSGQLAGIDLVREGCKENLERISTDRQERLRSYRTLGICAGIAIAILLI